MTIKNPKLYAVGECYFLRDRDYFLGCVDKISLPDNGIFKSIERVKEEIQNGVLLRSKGFRHKGYAVFELAAGEAFQGIMIFTNITQHDHPLRIGLEKPKHHRGRGLPTTVLLQPTVLSL